MLSARLRRLLQPLAHTPLHPQWLVFREKAALKRLVGGLASGRIIDIGCGDRWLADAVGTKGEYLALDYPPTVARGYPGLADVYGDAARLPFGDASADTVLLLDVLEHLREPDAAIAEAARVLRPGGRMVLQVPFLYPVHDAPDDYRRWTLDGLRQLLADHGLSITSETVDGHPMETAAVLGAIALAKCGLNLLARPGPALLLLPLIAICVPLANVGGWLLARLLPADSFMPLSYRLVAEHKQ